MAGRRGWGGGGGERVLICLRVTANRRSASITQTPFLPPRSPQTQLGPKKRSEHSGYMTRNTPKCCEQKGGAVSGDGTSMTTRARPHNASAGELSGGRTTPCLVWEQLPTRRSGRRGPGTKKQKQGSDDERGEGWVEHAKGSHPYSGWGHPPSNQSLSGCQTPCTSPSACGPCFIFPTLICRFYSDSNRNRGNLL